MKAIKTLLALLAITAPVSAATYTFDSYSLGADLDGVDGWSVSNNAPAIAYTTVYNTTEVGAAFGGYFNVPTAFPSSLSHTTAATSLDTGSTFTQVTFDLAVIDSDTSTTFTDRDSFGVTLKNSLGSSLVSLYFTPLSQDADPSTTTGEWALAYNFYDGSGLHTSAFTVLEDQMVNYTISFFAGTTEIDFGGPLKFKGTPTGYSGSDTLGSFELTWDATADGGSNYALLDNVSINSVPEPSAALLGAVGALGLFRRRRA